MFEFDELLNPRPLPPEPASMRAELARDAAVVQRRRRWIVRGRKVAVIGCIYLAGLATMWGWRQNREPPQTPPAMTERPETSKIVMPDLPQTQSVKRFDPPERLEKRAFLAATGEKRVELYRQAGDGFLLRDDVSSALRCYRKALDGGSAADLAIHTDRDTWLYMSLKVARQKEKADARTN